MASLGSSAQSDCSDDLPLVSQQPLEVDYIENRLPDYRDKDGKLPAKFNVEKQKFIPRPLTRTRTPKARNLSLSFDLKPGELQQNQLALDSTTTSFNTAIKQLKAEKGGKSKIVKFQLLQDCHNWAEVSNAIELAVATHESDASVGGKFRKMFRRVSNHAESIQSFVGLLPDGNYKTLCGGLTLILTAMTRYSEVREAMADLLDELPNFVKDCEDYMKVYRGRNMLRVRVNELYIELLAALESIVKWYTKPSRSRVFGALFKNSLYGQEIDQRILNIQKCKERFRAEADKFLHYRLKAMDDTALQTLASTEETKEGVDSVAKIVVQGNEQAETNHLALMRKLSLKNEHTTNILNNIRNVLGGAMENMEWTGERDRLMMRLLAKDEENEKKKRELEDELGARDREINELKTQATERDQLVNRLCPSAQSLADRLNLDLKADGHCAETDFVRGTGLNESIKFQARARWLANTFRFRKWLRIAESGALFVQGNGELDPVSPLSFLDTLLIERLAEHPKTLVLPFFCGVYDAPYSPESMSGPVILVRALLSQLLSLEEIYGGNGTGKDGLPFLSFLSQDKIASLEGGSFATFIDTIAILLSSLVSHYDSIFLIIDGLDYFDSDWEIETKRLIKRFVKLVRQFNERRRKGTEVIGSLKVLLTVSTYLEYVPERGKGVMKLDVPEEVDEDGIDELSEDE